MKIKLLKGWNGNSPGAVLEPELTDVGQILIDRGLAERVDDEPVKPQRKQIKLQEWVKKPEHQ